MGCELVQKRSFALCSCGVVGVNGCCVYVLYWLVCCAIWFALILLGGERIVVIHLDWEDWCLSRCRKLQRMHESSSALTQLHGVVIRGGTVGSVRGVCGAMMASVVPILVMARLSISHDEVPVGLVVVALAMEAKVAGWSRRMWRS